MVVSFKHSAMETWLALAYYKSVSNIAQWKHGLHSHTTSVFQTLRNGNMACTRILQESFKHCAMETWLALAYYKRVSNIAQWKHGLHSHTTGVFQTLRNGNMACTRILHEHQVCRYTPTCLASTASTATCTMYSGSISLLLL